MSGVRTGTRLEQLYRLAARVQEEIAAELRNTAPPKPTSKPSAQDKATARLAQLGVTSREVKTWAVHAGLRSHITRGRVSLELVEAYALYRDLPR